MTPLLRAATEVSSNVRGLLEVLELHANGGPVICHCSSLFSIMSLYCYVLSVLIMFIFWQELQTCGGDVWGGPCSKTLKDRRRFPCQRGLPEVSFGLPRAVFNAGLVSICHGGLGEWTIDRSPFRCFFRQNLGIWNLTHIMCLESML